ncbi:MAG: DNA polymerase IV, partial [Caulobacteraceae bacterium]
KSISAETTFAADLHGQADLEARLWPLCEKVARRARSAALAGRVVTLKARTSGFRTFTRRRTLPKPIQTASALFSIGRALLAAEAAGERWRLVGIGLSDLAVEAAIDEDLFAGGEARSLHAERALDALRARFGEEMIFVGRAWKTGVRS